MLWTAASISICTSVASTTLGQLADFFATFASAFPKAFPNASDVLLRQS